MYRVRWASSSLESYHPNYSNKQTNKQTILYLFGGVALFPYYKSLSQQFLLYVSLYILHKRRNISNTICRNNYTSPVRRVAWAAAKKIKTTSRVEYRVIRHPRDPDSLQVCPTVPEREQTLPHRGTKVTNHNDNSHSRHPFCHCTLASRVAPLHRSAPEDL